MTQARNSGGFSFELSESAPPVQATHHTPMGDLELDLGEFNLNHPAPSPLPEVVLSVAPPVAEIPEPWPSSPFSPLAPRAEAQPASPQHSDVTDPSPHQAPAESGELMFDLALPAQPTQPAAQPTQPAAQPTQPAALSSTTTPTIKKIQFPAQGGARSAKPSRVAAQPSRAAAKPKPATRFSASISQKAPAVSLTERDSDPFLDGIADREKSSLSAPDQGDQAVPEDLPLLSPLAHVAPAATTTSWESETPTARELWHNARRAWHKTSQTAATWSGRGLRSAQKVARNVHHKLQTRLEAEADAARTTPASVETEQRAPTRPLATAETLFAERSAEAQKAGAARWHAAGRAGQWLVKKAAAPLCAVAAASVVYLAGSHFLGAGGQVSLSSSRWAGPAVPELGSLPGAQERKSAPSAGAKAAPAPPQVAPMVSEVTALPEGLSWPGKGLIEVVTSEDELIYIDGVFTGRGPLRRVPVTPGKHDVAIKKGGEERTGTVVVEAEKNTRAVFTGAIAASSAP